MIQFDFRGSDVLVTGGVVGIGEGISSAYLKAGARVFATTRKDIQSDEVIKFITRFQNQSQNFEQFFDSDFKTHINESFQAEHFSTVEINAQSKSLSRVISDAGSVQVIQNNLGYL